MAELKASPRNKYVGKAADVLRSIRDTGDEVQIPVLGGLGSLFLGKSPEEINEWSYGNAPMQRTPLGDRLPKMKRGRGTQVADTAFAAMDLPALRALTAAAGRPLARALEDSPLTRAAEFVGEQRTPVSAVVKPKGGNWLTGSVEDALSGLKRNTNEAEVNAFRRVPVEERLRRINLNRPLNDQLSEQTYINSWLQRHGYSGLDEAGEHALTSAEKAAVPELALNSWIEGPLTKYVKTRMASPEDEVRKLAEQGVLHFEPENLPSDLVKELREVRAGEGFIKKGLAKTNLSKAWEDQSDFALEIGKAGKVLENPHYGWLNMKDHPWAAKLPPETPIYGVNEAYMSDNYLGFPHLIDELSNALNPASGLPRNLQLTPEAMKQLSMEKAVRRVADINAWRAAQKAEANRALAEQASLVREYAENNPKGLRWVELKAPENLTPEQQAYYDKLISVQTDPQVAMGAARKYGRNPLADQLKYEGDVMGHCVGGYCDDVLSGHSRIFSLRDAKGEPHVTIEVNPAKEFGQRKAAFEAEYGRPPNDLSELEEWAQVGDGDFQNRIVQIKGKQNRAPNEEYLPFVQDFVRNSPLGGQWSDVGDLGNTGLTKHPTGKFVTDAEANALFERHFGHPPDSENAWQYSNRIGRYDKDMLTDIDLNFLKDWKEGKFAQGGPVSSLPAEPTSGYNSWQSLFGEVA